MNLLTPVPKLSGRYKIEAFVPGNPPRVLAEFDNLLTNTGLNLLSQSDNDYRYCAVGTGNTTPAFTDTGLANLKSETSTITKTIKEKNVSAGYGYIRRTWEFAQGMAAGNLAEVGIFIYKNYQQHLFSRALIKDAQGSHSTITVLPDEILQVTWELRVFWPQTQATGVLNIVGGDTHSFSLKPTNVDFSDYWAPQNNFGHSIDLKYTYTGPHNQLTGGWDISKTKITRAYINNTFELIADFFIPINQANYDTGISAFSFETASKQTYMAYLDPPIMKTANDSLSLTVSANWARA